MSHLINRAGWSPEERAEYDDLLAEVVYATISTGERLDLFDAKLTDAIQAHRPWASEVARACRRDGMAREIKRHQDRQRVQVSYAGQVLSVPAVQARRTRAATGEVVYQRELIELWTWQELIEKRTEAIRARGTYDAKVAHYDRLLALRELSPTSATPAEAARLAQVDLDDWLTA